MRKFPPCLLLFLMANLASNGLQAGEAKPLTLSAAKEMALKQHPRISAAELEALAAKQVVSQVRSLFYPSLSFNATAAGTSQENTRVAAGALNNPAIYERQADGLVFSQLITDFGRTSHLTKTSQFRARAADKNAEATREQILMEVEAAFFNALKAQSVLEVSRQTLTTRQLLLDQVAVLATNKLKSELDVSFARVAREEGRLLVAKADNDLKSAFATLSVLLGVRDETNFQLVQDPGSAPPAPPATDGLVPTALAQRPDLVRLRLESDAAAQFARAEKGLRYPTLSAFGTGGLIPIRDPAFQKDYAAAGVNLNFPLFTGGLFRARQREAELRVAAAQERLREAENEVIRQVRVAGLNVQYAFDRLSLTEQLRQSSRQAFELAQARYRLGSSSIVELSQAQLNLTQAEIERASAGFDFQIQRALLNYAVGASSVTGAKP